MTIGQIAYDAYFDFSKGKSLISGCPLPRWDDQASKVKEAWEAAAHAVSRKAVSVDEDIQQDYETAFDELFGSEPTLLEKKTLEQILAE